MRSSGGNGCSSRSLWTSPALLSLNKLWDFYDALKMLYSQRNAGTAPKCVYTGFFVRKYTLPYATHWNKIQMVLLTVTPAAKAALEQYCGLRMKEQVDEEVKERLEQLSKADLGSPIEHQELIDVSQFMVRHHKDDDRVAKHWRLDALLKGATVYRPPPVPKPEPVWFPFDVAPIQNAYSLAQTPEYKALMRRLREQEEQRQYERMLNPPSQPETFKQRFPHATSTFGSGIDLGHNTADEVDDVTYADVNRQMILIMNVLISIICTSVAVWMAARRWSVPERLGLSFSSSTVVAVAEVAIYTGYIRRIKDAKTKERKATEKKEVIDTWVIDGNSTSQQTAVSEAVRFRKGKHR